MNSFDLISLSMRNLLRRKTRTLLAIVGVVVGTCAIIVMVSIGFGLSQSAQAQIESTGNLHLIDVFSGGGGGAMVMGDGASSMGNKSGVLDKKAVEDIGKIPGVTAASPKVEAYLSFGLGKYITSNNVTGVSPEMFQLFNYEVSEGRLLVPGDKFAVLFGNQVPSWFYNPKKSVGNSMGKPPSINVITDKLILTANTQYGQKPVQGMGGVEEKVNYKEYKTKGVGVLANPDDQSSYSTYMPIETIEKINEETAKTEKSNSRNKQKGYNSAMVYVNDLSMMGKVTQSIRDMGFQTNSLSEWLKQSQDQARMIQYILGGIGAVSLFVAALGITNTMIMSIYERTKEIGVMKVIGANLPDIKKMFLLEAGLIGLLGGLIGMIFSYMISFLINTLLAEVLGAVIGGNMGGTTISIIPWWVSVGALGFATIIGIVSGYFPARRAMKLSALESLRNE